MIRYLFVLLIFVSACAPDNKPPIEWGESPWPEIRKERINILLPQAMEAAGVDLWIVICRENNNDPIADHIGEKMREERRLFCFTETVKAFIPKYFRHPENPRRWMNWIFTTK